MFLRQTFILLALQRMIDKYSSILNIKVVIHTLPIIVLLLIHLTQTKFIFNVKYFDNNTLNLKFLCNVCGNC